MDLELCLPPKVDSQQSQRQQSCANQSKYNTEVKLVLEKKLAPINFVLQILFSDNLTKITQQSQYFR